MQPTAAWTLRLGGPLAHVDADPSAIGRSYPVDIGLAADAVAALRAITSHLPEECAAGDAGWAGRAREAAARARERALDRIGPDHRAICAAIRAHLPRDGVVVRDATVPAYTWGDNLLPILRPRTSLRPTSAAIGPGLPLAVGAAVGTGARTVVIQGDGGLMLSVGELATAAQYRLPITVCVFNDRGYGVLRGIQRATYDGTPHDVDLATPDFAALAESVGVRGVRVGGAAEFEAAFAASVAADGPTVLDIDLTRLAPITRIGGGQSPERDPGMRD
jgi:acetolactate synthase-1/2/3 large subunit